MTTFGRRSLIAFGGLVAGATILSGVLASPASAAEERKVSLMLSPAGSGPVVAYAVMQTRAKDNHPWLRPIAIETPGFNYNVQYLAKNEKLWKDTIIGSATVLEWAAKTGLKPFYPEPLKPAADYKIIGVMSLTGGIFVTTNKSINKLDDFAGKRIATGLLTQNEWGMYPRMIMDGLGISKKTKAINPLGTTPNVEAMLDGRADVSFLVAFSSDGLKDTILPGPFKLIEASKRDFHYISVTPAQVAAYNKKSGASFDVRKFPPNTLPNQPKEVTTFGNYLLMSAHKSFPDDLAYEFVKLWIKMGPTIAKFNAFGKLWTPESISAAARATPAAIHPGAMKAYKELGLVK